MAEAKLPRKEAGATGTQVRFLFDRAVFSKGCVMRYARLLPCAAAPEIDPCDMCCPASEVIEPWRCVLRLM